MLSEIEKMFSQNWKTLLFRTHLLVHNNPKTNQQILRLCLDCLIVHFLSELHLIEALTFSNPQANTQGGFSDSYEWNSYRRKSVHEPYLQSSPGRDLPPVCHCGENISVQHILTSNLHENLSVPPALVECAESVNSLLSYLSH